MTMTVFRELPIKVKVCKVFYVDRVETSKLVAQQSEVILDVFTIQGTRTSSTIPNSAENRINEGGLLNLVIW